MTIDVMTIGSFSILHDDHKALFQYCRKLAGWKGDVIVGVNSDDIIKEKKGLTPPLNHFERQDVIKQSGWADYTFTNNSFDVDGEWFEYFQPELFVVGADWYGKDIMSQIGFTFEDFNRFGTTLAFAPTLNRYHSSEIIKGEK